MSFQADKRLILAQVKQASADAKAMANKLDAAFIESCDPRALQGGAVCEDAAAWRDKAAMLRGIAAQLVVLIG